MNSSSRVREMYDQHPISAEQVLSRIEAERGSLDGLQAPDLFAHDQDHYSGLAANDALAKQACLLSGMKVADFCAGLGGPARYLAHIYGVHVTGIDLNAKRVAGARRLTEMVGLQDRVDMREGDATASGLDSGAFDAVISQEAFLHVPDKALVIGEAYRVLRPGGRLVFTDWVVHQPLSQSDTNILWQGLAAQTLQSIAGYESLLNDAGFEVHDTEDLTSEWFAVLTERFAMYKQLRAETSSAGLPQGEDAFYRAYERLVTLVGEKVLGGARFTAEKGSR